MSFKKSIQYSNDHNKAIKLIKETFLPLDFKITNISDNFIELIAQDNLIQKSGWWKQPEEALACVTKISFSFTHKKLFIQADFSDLDKNIRFTPIFAAIILITILVAIDIKLYLQGQAILLFFFLPIIAIIACIAGALALLPGLFMNRKATEIIENLTNQIQSLE
ncbi:MAG: hypothetical protein JXA96_17625 [Sedimentisphaerales bacterium]|nr:hypothetical protein [Sedimentisphaerales bacterium]